MSRTSRCFTPDPTHQQGCSGATDIKRGKNLLELWNSAGITSCDPGYHFLKVDFLGLSIVKREVKSSEPFCADLQ